MFETVVGEFEDLDATQTRIVEKLTTDEIAKALGQLSNIKRWCSDLEKFAVSELTVGRPVGGWKLVAGRGSRSWVKDENATAVALTALGLDPGALWERELLSPAKVEKLLPKADRAKIGPLVEKALGKPTLAPADDPRDALTADALAGFEDLKADEP